MSRRGLVSRRQIGQGGQRGQGGHATVERDNVWLCVRGGPFRNALVRQPLPLHAARRLTSCGVTALVLPLRFESPCQRDGSVGADQKP